MIKSSPLMLVILGSLWRERQLSLQRLHRSVCTNHHDVAMSTVSTTLTRLVQRGWVERPKPGYYVAGITRDALIELATQEIMDA